MTFSKVINDLNLIYPDESKIVDRKKYDQLLQHLPSEVRDKLLNYHPKARTFETKLLKLLDDSIFLDHTLYKVAQVALLAFRIQKIAFDPLITLFIKIGALEEFCNAPKMNQVTLVAEKPIVFTEKIKPLEIQPFSSGLASVTRKDIIIEEDKVSEQYIEKCHDLGLLDLPLQEPILKEYFGFDEQEWLSFSQRITKLEAQEQKFTTLNPPKFGCWSPMYDQLQRTIHCFKIIEVYNASSINHPPFKTKKMVLPSFSMLKIFIEMKAALHARPPMELAPVFGRLSYDDVAELKKKSQTPFGLYCPTPPKIDSAITKKHMDIIDGWAGNGPTGFWIHDLYHALRWMEIHPNICKALFYMVDKLDTYGATLQNRSRAFQKLRKIRNSLIDGELIFSYPFKPTLFKLRPFEAEPFGAIFTRGKPKWSEKLKDLLIIDMIVNTPFWESQFDLNETHLSDPEVIRYLAYQDLFKGTNRQQFTYVKNITASFVEEPQLKLIDSDIHQIKCELALVINSTFKKIKASGSLYVEACKTLESIEITVKKDATFRYCEIKEATFNSSSQLRFYFSKVQRLNCDSSSVVSFISCDSLLFIQGGSQVKFRECRSLKCENIQAPNIEWIPCERELHFTEYECENFTLIDSLNEPCIITFENCKIDNLLIKSENKDRSQMEKNLKITSSNTAVPKLLFI